MFLTAAVVVFLTTLFGRYPKVKVALNVYPGMLLLLTGFYLNKSAACHALLLGDLVPMLDGYALLWSCSGDVEFDPVSCSTKARLVVNLLVSGGGDLRVENPVRIIWVACRVVWSCRRAARS